jgi:amino acid transporter
VPAGFNVIGPGAIAIVIGFVVIFLCAVAIVVDGLRRKPWDFAGVREGRWPYVVIAGAYVFVWLLAQVPALTARAPVLGTAQVLATPVMFVAGIVYLLRVVFPTPKRLELRRAAREASGE